MAPWWQSLQELSLVAAGTWVSEDLTCVTTGLLIREGRLDWVTGFVGCFVGIVLGDWGIWWLGRLVRAGAHRWRRDTTLSRWLQVSEARTEQLASWYEHSGWLAILASRFLPGTRVPLYLAIGMLGRSARSFVFWCAVGAGLWTPVVLGLAATVGETVATVAPSQVASSWLVLMASVVVGLGIVRGVGRLGTAAGRKRFHATVSRIWRWEFWPSWLFYLPVVPYWIWLAARHRSWTVWTLANPAIPDGGVVGESKAEILAQLPAEWTVPTLLIPEGPLATRLRLLNEEVRRRQWEFPLILKPDASQRGAGVKLVTDGNAARAYLEQQSVAVIAQPYHPGPFEVGIFYFRLPDEPRGQILSITAKVFPQVTGDGTSTLAELILAHPRYRMQAGTFLARHATRRDHVLNAGETFGLAVAGNHCQGTMFLDGGHLHTPELAARIDSIARAFPGFYFGRFDARYRDESEFRAGQDLAIVELNGVTSESTNIYDPNRTLWSAYRVLCQQWELAFRIGNSHRQRGIQPRSVGELLRSVRAYYQRQRTVLEAD